MQIDLSGMNILVTGASRGIGLAIAKNLAESGARVAVHCNQNIEKANQLATEMGGGARAFQADLSDSEEALRLFEQVIATFGQLDAVINNAGIAIPSDLTASDNEWVAAWEKTMQVNLTSAGLLTKKFVEHLLIKGHPGRIINISSRAAFRGDTAEYLAYASSKAGLVALTKSIARAYGKSGITAFVVAPGFVRTDMANDFIERYGVEHAEGDIALKRLTQPGDLAPLVTFLASGLADHATGSTFDLNAGSYMH